MRHPLLLAALLCTVATAAPKISITAPEGLPPAARLAPELGPEGLAVRKSGNALTLSGGDGVGLMYAAFDAAGRIAAGNPFASIGDVTEKPFLKERALSIYTMHRGLFEKRLHSEGHWERYFDMLARSRLNPFVLIFGYENGGYMAPAHPYFFDVEGFPGVRVTGLAAGCRVGGFPGRANWLGKKCRDWCRG
jgi:hypothetical protein